MGQPQVGTAPLYGPLPSVLMLCGVAVSGGASHADRTSTRLEPLRILSDDFCHGYLVNPRRFHSIHTVAEMLCTTSSGTSLTSG